jgi:hypothetical protein
MNMRSLLAPAALVVATTAARPARAEPVSEMPGGPAFHYDRPQERQYVRAVLEELGILGLGEIEYQVDQSSNAVDWDLAYDWPSFRSKLTFQSVAFDTNRFPTNWVTHPASGYLYYSAARSNRLSMPESFLFSVAASTLWEYIGEYREQVSVNDQIVTPFAGAVLGEATMQLGAFFRRGRRTTATTALAWLFAAPKQVHDAVDGAVPTRASEVDDLGLPEDEWHRFRVVGSAAVTHQDHGVVQSDGRVSIASRIVALDSYERPGQSVVLFDSGEVSTLGLDIATGGSALVDLQFATTTMPAGAYARDLRLDERGRLVGHGLLGGMTAGLEYGVHDYDRDGHHPIDEIAMVDVGATGEHVWHAGSLVVRSSLTALADFAGVSSYALTRYARTGSLDLLPTVLAGSGYYHAVGVTIRPEMTVEIGRADVGGEARIDGFEAITALDRDRPSGTPTLEVRDRRVSMRAWLGVSPAAWLHLSIAAERRQRNGRIGRVSDGRGETSFAGNVELRF